MKKQYSMPTTEQMEMLGGSCMHDTSSVVNNTKVDGEFGAPVIAGAPKMQMPD